MNRVSISIAKILVMQLFVLMNTVYPMNCYKSMVDEEVYNAVNTNDIDFFRNVLSLDGSNANMKDVFGHSLLWIAVCHDACDIVRLLLEYKADVNNQGMLGEPVLVQAVRSENIGIARLLCEYRADVNVQSDLLFSATPLRNAAETGNVAMAALLFEYKADVNRGEKLPLEGAVENDHKEMVTLLLDHNADIDVVSGGGVIRYPLGVAINKENVDMVQLLIKRGARVNRVCRGIDAPLGGIVSKTRWLKDSHLQMLVLLLTEGADPNISIELGSTPLMHIVNELSKKGLAELMAALMYQAAGLQRPRLGEQDCKDEAFDDTDKLRSTYDCSPIRVRSVLGQRIKDMIYMLMKAGAHIDSKQWNRITIKGDLPLEWQRVFIETDKKVKQIVLNALEGRDWDAEEVIWEVVIFLEHIPSHIVAEYVADPELSASDEHYSIYINKCIRQQIARCRDERRRKSEGVVSRITAGAYTVGAALKNLLF